MNDKARQYREQLKVETINTTNTITGDVPEGFDMQYMPTITFIDDEPTIGKTIEQRLPSVSCDVLSIEDLGRCISKGYEGCFDRNDLIFIDTFYRDPENDNRYAIDYFDMYRKLSNETIAETEGKYKVVVSMDEIERRTKAKTIGDIAVVDENLNISKLWSRIKKHPILEYREGSSKVDTIIKAIEEYAQRNKIYLYKNSEMSFKEWVAFIKDLINRVNNTIQNLQTYNESENFKQSINDIVSEFRNAIDEANKQLGLDENGEKTGENKIKSIEDAVKCTKTLCKKVSSPKQELMDLGVEESEYELCHLSHELGNSLLSAGTECYRAEKRLEKKALEGNSK